MRESRSKKKERRQRSGAADVLESYQHKFRIPRGRERRGDERTVVYRRKEKPSFDAIGGGNQITKLSETGSKCFFYKSVRPFGDYIVD